MSERPTSGPAPRWGEYAPVPEQRAPEPQPEPQPVEEPPAATPRPTRSWDVALTIGLLAFGVLNVLTGIPSMLNLPETLDTVYRAGGYGTYTSDELASGIGIAVNISQVSLLILAVALSTRSLKARRVTFWIPLTIGVVATLIMVVLLAVAMLSDPAFGAYFEEQMRSAGGTAP